MTIRVAVVGLGKMGLMHASIMGMLQDVELVAICEKNGLVRRFATRAIPNIEIVADMEQLANLALDAICVTTPPGSHFSIIRTAYERGITRNIFTEKPLAANYLQSRELCKMADDVGGVNMVGYHRRFSVTFGKARQLLESGILGNLTTFEAHAYSADFLGARTAAQAIARGGVMEDSGCHIVDMADWLLGEIEVVDARVVSLLGPGSEDEAFIQVRTKDGVKGELSASWCKEGYRLPEMEVEITGSDGTLLVNEDNVELTSIQGGTTVWYKHDLNDVVPFSIGGNEYQRQDNLFVNAVRRGGKVEPSFITASRVEHVIGLARERTK
jgi:predicted dehydrogenase